MQKGVELDERDFFQDSLSEKELRSLLGDRSAADFFSWKSPSFKRLGLDRESLDDDRLIGLMLQEPRLIRRPLIAAGDELVVGTDKAALERLFP